jgi:copper chaperone
METVKVKGMSCNHCVMAVRKALEAINGIKNVEVDLARGEARFEAEPFVDMKALEAHIKKAGYDIG